MNRSRLLATAAASIGLAVGAFVPSAALAETPDPVGPLTATRVPRPPLVIDTPPTPKDPGVVVKPPVLDPPVLDPGDVWPTPPPTPTHSPKPPKPPVHDVPTVPPVVNPDPRPTRTSEPPSPSASPSESPAGSTDGGGSANQDDPEYPGTGLPVTGASVGILAAAGLLLAIGGALLVGFARRRRTGLR